MNATLLKLVREKGIKSPFPRDIKPMLCALVKQPIDDPGFLYEVKWDGYRILSYAQSNRVKMGSRSNLDYTKKYPPVAKALKELQHELVLDGEVVVLNEQGHPDFDALQQFNGHNTPVYYYVFDILYLDGYDLKLLPLEDRKKVLAGVCKGNEVIRYSDHFDNGPDLFNQVEQLGMEGIIAKRRNSVYKPGERGKNWFKTPTEIKQEFVIGGWAESDRGRPFASLLFGAYNKGQLEWIGHAGGGFKEEEMPGILRKLKALEVKERPFVNKVETGRLLHWVKPVLVANFKFATWTKSGKIRKPAIFLGFRTDKNPGDVVREIPKDNEAIDSIPQLNKDKLKQTPKKKIGTSSGSNWKKMDAIKIAERQDFNIGDCTIEMSDIGREIWKGVTKFDLIQYYHSVADYILPHLKDRPQSLHIKPVNAGAPGFYIKDMEGREPACADIFTDQRKHKKEGKRAVIDYLVCNNEATLLYMINLGCIDINPWTSTVSAPNEPDYIVIDLDPSDNDFSKAIETAKAAKQFFDKHQLKAFVKTSGKTGIHLLLPCKGFTFPQARKIAEKICSCIHEMVPLITTTEVSIDLRGTKLYIDPNQNDYADTIAAPYAVRPSHAPTVSIPIEWKEVNSNLHPANFTIENVLKRIDQKGDLFKNLLNKKTVVANTKSLSKIIS